jgi:hypothetical protein
MPLLLGVALVVASVAFYIADLPTERASFPYDMAAFVEQWNHQAAMS